MGLESRDYVRNEPRWPGGGGYGAASGSITKQLILVTAGVFLLQMLTTGRAFPNGGATRWLVLDWRDLQHGQVWRLLTYAFCHSTRTFTHILFNMLVLWFAGRAVESLLGSAEFLRFYLLAAIAAAVAYVGLDLAMGDRVNPMLGASGATMAVFAVFAVHYPRAKVYIMGVIPVEARFLLVLFVVQDMWPLLNAGNGPGTGVAHAAHLGGLAFGIWYVKSGANIGRWWSGISARRRSAANPDVRLYEPSREELEERVDALLDKIREQGESSLTDAEREFLKQASRQYRQR